MSHSKNIKVLAYFIAGFLVITCKPDPLFPAGEVKGYKPIYASAIDAKIAFEFGLDLILEGLDRLRDSNF